MEERLTPEQRQLALDRVGQVLRCLSSYELMEDPDPANRAKVADDLRIVTNELWNLYTNPKPGSSAVLPTEPMIRTYLATVPHQKTDLNDEA